MKVIKFPAVSITIILVFIVEIQPAVTIFLMLASNLLDQKLKIMLRKTTMGIGLIFCLFLAINTNAQEVSSTSEYEVSDEVLKEYVGVYTTTDSEGFDVEISLDGESRLMGQPVNKMHPQTILLSRDKDKFELKNTNGIIIQFKRDETGKVTSFTMTQGAKSFIASKKGA